VLLLRQDDTFAIQLPSLIRNAEHEAEEHCAPALQLVMHDRSNLDDFFLKRVPCSLNKGDALEDDLYATLKHDPKYAHHPKVVAHSPNLQGVSPRMQGDFTQGRGLTLSASLHVSSFRIQTLR
jgi:hypothetical protein